MHKLFAYKHVPICMYLFIYLQFYLSTCTFIDICVYVYTDSYFLLTIFYSVSTMLGACLGTSPTIVYVESAAGMYMNTYMDIQICYRYIYIYIHKYTYTETHNIDTYTHIHIHISVYLHIHFRLCRHQRRG
jgi:hypothetical protein